jgi:transposase
MPSAYLNPYVKRHKNDAIEAEAICEAVTRVNMQVVTTKSPEQQSCLKLNRTRHLFIRHQISVINAMFGIAVVSRSDGTKEISASGSTRLKAPSSGGA